MRVSGQPLKILRAEKQLVCVWGGGVKHFFLVYFIRFSFVVSVVKIRHSFIRCQFPSYQIFLWFFFHFLLLLQVGKLYALVSGAVFIFGEDLIVSVVTPSFFLYLFHIFHSFRFFSFARHLMRILLRLRGLCHFWNGLQEEVDDFVFTQSV